MSVFFDKFILIYYLKIVHQVSSQILLSLSKTRNSKGGETCNSHMWVLTDAREYSIVQIPYLESDRLHSIKLLVYV